MSKGSQEGRVTPKAPSDQLCERQKSEEKEECNQRSCTEVVINWIGDTRKLGKKCRYAARLQEELL